MHLRRTTYYIIMQKHCIVDIPCSKQSLNVMEFEYSTFRALVTFLKTWYSLGSLGRFLFCLIF